MSIIETDIIDSNLPGISWEEYHEVFRGTRLKDTRPLIDENLAPQVRWLAVQINAYTEKTLPEIARELESVSASNLYTAARGKAGLKVIPETGLSTTQEVYYGLLEYRLRLQEE